ncbi:hypothetical protein BUALT_Bualt12G0089800 [Buddleja alternifolia]|uniref:UBA domain-containing protein n=1 Tax=Buddleja alternifolia TaxID=168488 RepID=A0AAV6WX26_9LAMI|nr:hypothetical protein BUALT_Bualt12G0089800 [Buddleja alternifolia]
MNLIPVVKNENGAMSVFRGASFFLMTENEVEKPIESYRDKQCVFIDFSGSGDDDRDDDGPLKLSQLGIKNNSKILASKVSTTTDHHHDGNGYAMLENMSVKELFILMDAVTSLASRHADGSLPVEDFNLELENQSGEKVQLGSETDQRAIMMGLMLHANAKTLIRRQQFKDALEVLTMGEEAFSLCDPKLIEMVDNVSILQIDMVWCYFMLRDISWLSVAGIRLSKAREGIERAHGKESSRMRILQGNRYPELALHLRMELLEGVVAYHSGQLQKSKDSLTSAQAKYFQLQVPDEALSLLMSMGYKQHEAKRALRMNNLDVGSAIDFLVEEKEKKAQKHEENLQRQKEILEQKEYGMTPHKKAVDIQKLNELVSIGFEKALAAEALRRNENDTQNALDDLTNPEKNSVLQNEIISRARKRLRKATKSATENLVSMGFSRASAPLQDPVDAAVSMFGNEEEALSYLLGQPVENTANVVEGADPSIPLPNDTHGTNSLATADDVESNAESSGGDRVERDVEMEDELTEGLHGADAYSDYDIEVTKEGEAINEYLAFLNSAQQSS